MNSIFIVDGQSVYLPEISERWNCAKR